MRKFIAFIEHFFSALTRYSRYEQRGVILLIGIAMAVLLVAVFRPVKKADAAFLEEADRLNDSLRTAYFARNASGWNIRQQAVEVGGRSSASAPRYAPKPTVYIELNTADSARLTTVRGIGPVISRNIVAYRDRLGGFVRKEQLREVYGITDENFPEISEQFFLDTAVIQKIDINFAPANVLAAHPYISRSMADRVVRARNLKGGWGNLRELTEHDILLPDEAQRVAPYVVFNDQPNGN